VNFVEVLKNEIIMEKAIGKTLLIPSNVMTFRVRPEVFESYVDGIVTCFPPDMNL